MPQLILQGDTLGEKHKNFNKSVQYAITNKRYHLTQINTDENDIDNLFKIDLASKTKNVDYIIEVFKCNDMLYISKAIKESKWLITEKEYAHIINPEYLHTQLFPHMLNKAIAKLLLHVRLHLKDEKRCKVFYDYFKDTKYGSHKWLLNCSPPVIENVIQNEWNISLHLFKRLCKLSVNFLQYYTRVKPEDRNKCLKTVLFLIKSDTEKYLNVLLSNKNYCLPSFGRKSTEIIMKTSSQIILENFQEFIILVDVPTVVKYIKKDKIKNFLFQYLKIVKMKYSHNDFNNIQYFIMKISEEERFQFVKRTFIDNNEARLDGYCLARFVKSYYWYQYAPFEIAFTEVKKLIRGETSASKRCALLQILITCAKCDAQYTKTLLQYYSNEHQNEPIKFKLKFINNAIEQIATHELDKETWNILDDLFYGLEVYADTQKNKKNNVQFCTKCIILYKVLHNENIPDIIKKKIVFEKFNSLPTQLNEEQKNKILYYLITSLYAKIQNLTIVTESDFNNAFNLLNTVLNLLMHWKKDLSNYSFVFDKIKELIKLKRLNLWTSKDLSTLYTMNKSWRKQMFNISMDVCPSEEVCINALKHDPQLLIHHSAELDILRTDDKISLRRLLAKLRVYWPDSLAKQWADAYLIDFNKSTNHKTFVNGIFELLPQQKVLNIIAMKDVPEERNICENKVDHEEFSLRKNIAKKLYKVRPMISLDVVLRYAKSDYFPYTVPSLNAIIHNISNTEGRDYVPKFLEAPESLQKFGLYLAYKKMNYKELIPIFLDVWNTNRNTTIRFQLFSYTHSLLCNVTDPSSARQLWAILKKFIDDLTAVEKRRKYIFSKLSDINKIHISVQGEFYQKSYQFLTAQPANVNCETHIYTLINCTPDLITNIDTDFVAEKILTPVLEKIENNQFKYINLMSSYVLHGQTEEEQCVRCRRVLVPALKQAFKSWNTVDNNKYIMKDFVDTLLIELVKDSCKFICLRRIIIPVKLFTYIRTLMENGISINENYILYTSWKLTTEYIKLVADYKDMLYDPKLNKLCVSSFENGCMPDEAVTLWESVVAKMTPKLGHLFTKHLMHDCENYFPSVSVIFREALNKTFCEHFNFQSCLIDMDIMKYMIVDNDFIPSYLVVCYIICRYGGDYVQSKLFELRKILSAHPSKEVQFHYGTAFGTLSISLP